MAALAVAWLASGGVASAEPPAPAERVVAPRRSVDGQPPLLVLLHGYGADEKDVVALGEALDPRLLVVSVRAPQALERGWSWFHLDFRPEGGVVPNVAQARTAVADLVRWLKGAPARLRADARRVYLLGFSQGAMMSLAVLRTAPELVAGVVALSGTPAEGLVATPAADAAIARVAVFVGHGTDDRLLPVTDGRAIRDRLQPLVRDFTYREYPINHAVGPNELRDVAAWLSERLDRPLN